MTKEQRLDLSALIRLLRKANQNLTNHSNLNRLLINALVASHPAPEVLARAIEHEKEKFLAHALPRDRMTDEQIDFIQKNAARIAAELRARRRRS